jgi:hypothetical protein
MILPSPLMKNVILLFDTPLSLKSSFLLMVVQQNVHSCQNGPSVGYSYGIFIEGEIRMDKKQRQEIANFRYVALFLN